MLGMLGLRIFEACNTDIADIGEEHGHRVLRMVGKGCKIVPIPLPPAVGRGIDHAIAAAIPLNTERPTVSGSRCATSPPPSPRRSGALASGRSGSAASMCITSSSKASTRGTTESGRSIGGREHPVLRRCVLIGRPDHMVEKATVADHRGWPRSRTRTASAPEPARTRRRRGNRVGSRGGVFAWRVLLAVGAAGGQRFQQAAQVRRATGAARGGHLFGRFGGLQRQAGSARLTSVSASERQCR